MLRVLSLLVGCLVLAVVFPAAAAGDTAQLIESRKIWDAGRHNAFTDLVRWHGRWWCTFREADAHVGGDGRIRVIVSDDGQKWESAALVDEKDIDLRDPKFSVAPDDRLMIVAGGSVYLGTAKLKGRQPRVMFSADGRTWSRPQRILADGDWLWRVTWQDGKAYGTSYNNDGDAKAWNLKLYSSGDGVKWDVVCPLEVTGRPNETTLRFNKAGEMLALVRREAGNRMGWLGTAKPPYKEWKWQELNHQLGGPNFVELPDGSWAVGTRDYTSKPATTMICRLFPQDGKSIVKLLTLPSGGDTSYPGLVFHEGVLWVSYYSSHEGKTDIYLAKVKVPIGREGEAPAEPALSAPAARQERRPPDVIGTRPYEMEWAGRTRDQHPAMVDFEDLAGWTVEAKNAEATFTQSREQQLWGKFVGKLRYRSTGAGGVVLIRPPQPIPLPAEIDCVNLWVYGNRLGWSNDPKTPPAQIGLIFRDNTGKDLAIALHAVDWKEWHLLHWKFTPEQRQLLAGGAFAAISVRSVTIPEERLLYFDNLSVYKDALAPLRFEPRPKRNLTLFPGQSPGTNTGPGTLPFPTREETILPSITPGYGAENLHPVLRQDGSAYVFTCDIPKIEVMDDRKVEVISYRYEPKSGDFSDILARYGQTGLHPMAEGGVRFAPDGGSNGGKPEKAELIACTREGDAVIARWRLTLGQRTADVTYIFRMWQKSLVIDVLAPGGQIGEVRFGRAAGVLTPQQVPVPFLDYRQAQRPLTLAFDHARGGLFLAGYVDWYRSNASELFNASQAGPDWAEYNGGSRYLPKTDGKRNDCCERLFLTISNRFEETLPNIPNPKSPWMEAMADRIWRAHGASDRKKDYEYFARFARYGMTKLTITDHETGWRDGCESFTFRTRTAPGRGGDESQREYSAKMQALGFRYGIYNNYTDFAPVNGFWDEDMVARKPDGNWLPAWYRCYTPKPARAVEYEAKLAPIIQEKFKLSTTYCDVHTAIPPWSKEDYDARVPGAGTFAGTFYAYGELLLHQKRTWDGPTYSEGGSHWIYTGLTDGNYGQDETAKLPTSPWLVDFDLLKMHPLGMTFGMGNVEMFFGSRTAPLRDPAERDKNLDLFLAATVAFGHTGFFVTEAGVGGAARSYFTLQGPQQKYVMAQVRQIQYADEQGRLWPTSQALVNKACQRRQIVTTYDNGCVVVVNGHPTETWTYRNARSDRGFALPPAGYVILADDPAGLSVQAFGGIADGHRADYAVSKDYIYCDGRGSFTSFDKLGRRVASDGGLIVLNRNGSEREVIPLPGCKRWLVEADAKTTATALDEDRHEIGPAQAIVAGGMAQVQPVNGAFSYLLK